MVVYTVLPAFGRSTIFKEDNVFVISGFTMLNISFISNFFIYGKLPIYTHSSFALTFHWCNHHYIAKELE